MTVHPFNKFIISPFFHFKKIIMDGKYETHTIFNIRGVLNSLYPCLLLSTVHKRSKKTFSESQNPIQLAVSTGDPKTHDTSIKAVKTEIRIAGQTY